MPPAAFPLLIPLGCFLVLAVLPPVRRLGAGAGVLSCFAAAATLALSLIPLFLLGTEPHPDTVRVVPWLVHGGRTIAEIGVRWDGISSSMATVVALVSLCVQVYSLGYLKEEPPEALGRYYAWHSLFLFSMNALVLAPNLLQAFAGWELVGLCSYLLIGYWWQKPEAAKAAVKALWVTKFADMGFVLGLVVLYAVRGNFSWEGVPAEIAPGVAALLLIGVMGKSAQVPLHVWLPDAMEGPTPVSALLHAATMVAAGVFLVVRAYPIFADAGAVLAFMCWLGAGTAIVAAAVACVQDDIKKVLAYSTCSQLGVMVAGLGTGSDHGAYFHLGTHAFFKALLFLGAGCAIHAVASNRIQDMGGLWKKTRVSAALFTVGALALVGVPPLAGWFSKDTILEELWFGGHLGPFAVCAAGVALTGFYMGRVLRIAFFGPASAKAEHAHESPAVMIVPLVPLAIGAVFAGWAGGFVAELLNPVLAGAESLAGPLGGKHHVALSIPALIPTVLGVGGLAFGLARPDGIAALAPLGRLARSGAIDRFWDRRWRTGLLPAARGAGWFDRYVVDGAMNAIGWAALRGGDALRTVQTGRAPDYLFAVVVGLLLFAAYGAVAGPGGP